ncbi:uncharacterized protein N7477_002032 [Penicillium maclennaniae]|uniref:uncharacterized protein n=1 Tax=Penicillium maclennaniae TaxID=1343394 RepID=UPI0025409499|nr:uncharacterized protein N7477_002032 [Penicillium maclennaniae]KAJ5682092.1 hypothetical protein N7477_002032 [Penicillium maclennaniae]
MQIIWQDSDTYEDARIGRVFNHRRPRRFPLAVVKATCEEDIVAAVKLAVERNCRVAVRSGGHSWAAWSVRDNSILIDLGNFKQVEVDAENRIARATPSMTGRELNSVLIRDHQLMFPGGHCPDVGLGGFLLQGGMGWNCRNWGWACERVEAVDVVTAEGNLLHCNAEQNSELYWAARGAGPGFPGVVTKFHLRLNPYPKNGGFRSSGYIYPIHCYREVFRWIIELSPTFDKDTEIAAISHFPEGSNEMRFFVLFVTMKDSAEAADKVLRPAQQSRPAGTVDERFSKEDSLDEQYNNQAAANPENHRYCADNAYMADDADVPAVLEEAFTTLPIANHSHCGWVRSIMEKVERHSVGAYLGDSDFQVRKTKFWADENAKRLMEIRRRWDPTGRICGYLDQGDVSGTQGLDNAHEW